MFFFIPHHESFGLFVSADQVRGAFRHLQRLAAAAFAHRRPRFGMDSGEVLRRRFVGNMMGVILSRKFVKLKKCYDFWIHPERFFDFVFFFEMVCTFQTQVFQSKQGSFRFRRCIPSMGIVTMYTIHIMICNVYVIHRPFISSFFFRVQFSIKFPLINR